MPDAIEVEFNGMPHKAVAVHVVSSTETWNTYLLDDGATLRLKTVLVSVLRLADAYDQDGNPVYVTRAQNLAVADAPANLRRKP
jgi:hypothetical protein